MRKNIKNSGILSRGLRVAAAVVGTSAALSAATVGMSASHPAGATTVGQISDSVAGSLLSNSWTVTGSGFGSGQNEIVEAVDQNTGAVLAASAPVTATVGHVVKNGLWGFAFVPGGYFSVQLSWTANCDDVHLVAYTSVFIDGHSVYMANSNSIDMNVCPIR